MHALAGMVSVLRAPHCGQVIVLCSSSIDFRQHEQDAPDQNKADDSPPEPRASTKVTRRACSFGAQDKDHASHQRQRRQGRQNLGIGLSCGHNRKQPADTQSDANQKEWYRATRRESERSGDPACRQGHGSGRFSFAAHGARLGGREPFCPFADGPQRAFVTGPAKTLARIAIGNTRPTNSLHILSRGIR